MTNISLNSFIRLLSVALIAHSSFNTFAAQENIKVKGYGANESAALNDAKKIAIGKVCGETIVGSTKLVSETEKNSRMDSSGDTSKSINTNTKSADENLSLVGGAIKSYKLINKGVEDGNTYVEIEAIVSECKRGDAVQSALSNQMMIEQLQKINAELKKLGTTNNVVSKPTTLAQKYHNARMLSQRGEIDLALKAYEDVVKDKIIFADPIQDMVTLSKRIYGLEGSKKYLEKSLAHLKGRPEYFYAIQQVEEKPITELWQTVKQNVDNFPPLGYIYLKKYYEYCFTLSGRQINSCLGQVTKLDGAQSISQKLINKIKSGENMNYYIDSNKASKDSEDFTTMFGNSFFTSGL